MPSAAARLRRQVYAAFTDSCMTVRAALRFVTAETVDAVFAHALALPKKEAAVEHLTAIAGMERQEVRCGDQL